MSLNTLTFASHMKNHDRFGLRAPIIVSGGFSRGSTSNAGSPGLVIYRSRCSPSVSITVMEVCGGDY